MQQPDVLQAKRVLVGQLALTFLLATASLPFGTLVALSVLIGAVVCLLASSFFAFWVFRRYQVQEPGMLLVRFYGAEVIKLSLIFVLFAVAFTMVEGLNLPALLTSYFAVQVLPAIVASSWGTRKTSER